MKQVLAAATCAMAMLIATAIGGLASECLGNPEAIGTGRVLGVDPSRYREIGAADLVESLPLRDHELVLTFDDGPMRPATDRVLDTLRAQCAAATFFIIGARARSAPDLVRRAYDEGHAIGTHTQSHPHLGGLTYEEGRSEIAQGMREVAAALGSGRVLSPFFRAPYFELTDALQRYLSAARIAVWGADFMADDWSGISGEAMVRLALERIEARGRGVLLLHDVMAPTVAGLPALLRELRLRGYHIVHVVSAPTGEATSVSAR